MKSINRNQRKFRIFFWQFFHVLSFTIIQAVKGKKYVKLTMGIMFLLIGIALSGSVIFVYSGHKKEEKDTSIEKVWILEDTLEKDFLESNENPAYKNIDVEQITNSKEISPEQLGAQDIFIDVQKKKNSFVVKGVLAEDSLISEEEAEEFMDIVEESFYQGLVKSSGITQTQLELLEKERIGDIYVAGDSEHGLEWMLTVSVPVFIGIFIYFIIVMYGQNIMLEVSSEKTSKLMETMLVDVSPEALVSGKILGTAFLGILQVLLWIGGLIYGLVIGVLFGSVVFPEESSRYETVAETTRSYGIHLNFTSGLLMAVLIVGLGILLYCFLAGIPGSLIAKPEHAGNVQQMIQIPLMVCFIVTYLAIFMEKKELLVFLRYIPFTAPFVLPGELLVGTSSVGTAWIASGLLLAAVALLGILSGKIYKYKALNGH